MKYRIDSLGMPMNCGIRMRNFAERAHEAYQTGLPLGRFIVQENERIGHSLSWDALRLLGAMWERWTEITREGQVADALEEADVLEWGRDS